LCGTKECPADTSCAVGNVNLDCDGSLLAKGGVANVSVSIYKGPEAAQGGDDYEQAGELNLGNAVFACRQERDITEQAVDAMAHKVGEHLDAGRCLLQLVQNQPV